MDGAVLGGALCVLAIGVLVGTVIGAVFLRAAIALFNKIVGASGPPDGVPEPLFGRAMGITFVTSIVNAVAGFLIGLVVGAGAQATEAGKQSATITANLISTPLSLLIMAGMLTAMLPTSFGKAILVTLLYLVIVVVVVGIIVLGFVVLAALVFRG